MDIKEAVEICLTRKFSDFSGVAGREEFWWFFLADIVAGVVIGAFSGWLWLMYMFGTLIPMWAVGARRLHDIGKSGWWQLLLVVPFVGFVVLVMFWAQEGETDRAKSQNTVVG